MAEEKNSDEKTEQPTDRKREESRKEGMVSFSREVSYIFVLGGFIISFYFAGNYFLTETAAYFRLPFLDFNVFVNNERSIVRLFGEMLYQNYLIFAGIFILLLIMGLIGGIIQVGFSFHSKPLQPDLGKLNPLKGIMRIFGKRMFGEIFIIIGKCLLAGFIFYAVLSDNLLRILNLSALNSKDFFSETSDIVWIFIYKFFIAYILIAAFDYAFKRWIHEMNLKMTKQEIKDELKQTEGDPLIKAKIRETQRKMSQARMLQEVPKADVIITNPTHFAVALRYDRETMVSPVMTAKGKDFIALRMMDIAKKNDVPIMRNPPIARDMYARVEIGEEIPEDFYKIIAEILAFVYKQKNRTVAQT